jgi:hypothetical protein
MIGWMILLAVFCVVALILWSRIRGEVIFGDELSIRLLVWFLRFRVYPPKEKSKSKKSKKQEKEDEEKTKEKGGKLSLFRQILPLAIDTLGWLKKKIRVDLLQMKIVWGGEDPAAVAVGFGAVNAAVGMIWLTLDNNFDIRARSIETSVNFQQKVPTIYLRAKISIRIGSAILIFFRVLRRGLPVYQVWKGAKAAAENVEVEIKK